MAPAGCSAANYTPLLLSIHGTGMNGWTPNCYIDLAPQQAASLPKKMPDSAAFLAVILQFFPIPLGSMHLFACPWEPSSVPTR